MMMSRGNEDPERDPQQWPCVYYDDFCPIFAALCRSHFHPPTRAAAPISCREDERRLGGSYCMRPWWCIGDGAAPFHPFRPAWTRSHSSCFR